MKPANLTALSVAIAASLSTTGAFAASCKGVSATVYVDGTGTIVGGPSDGQAYNGVLKGDVTSPNVIKGTDGDDRIVGGILDDLICAGPGNDFVNGGRGDDVIWGQAGEDDLIGGVGSDEVHGGGGADNLDESGGSANDTNSLYGEGGRDHIDGSRGDDYINGGSGRDTINGGAGDDEIVGGKGADILFGDGGNDYISHGEYAGSSSPDYKMDYINCGKGKADTAYLNVYYDADSLPEVNNCENVDDGYYSF
jgi:Ca2+-binding RTX toxin-like protein